MSMDTLTPVDPRLIDVFFDDHDGYPDELREQDTTDVLSDAVQRCGAVVTAFPKSLWIEPKDWADACRQNDLNKTWPINFIDRFTNQGSGNGGVSTHECTSHGGRAVFEAAWNRQRHYVIGPPEKNVRKPESAKSASVWVSCLSVYAEANPQQWGGAMVREILEISATRGWIPDKIQPRDYGFKHQLQGTCGAGGINQSRGSWVSVANFPAGWQQTAKHFRPLEFCFPQSFEETVCLVLNGYAVSVGRSGHCIPYAFWNEADRVMGYVDSYDVIRYDSARTVSGTPGGSYAILTTTQPDDWNFPAGK